MLYCGKCKCLTQEGGKQKCASCGNTKVRPVGQEDYVLLQRADQFTVSQLVSRFEDFSLDFQLEEFGKGRLSYLYDSDVMPTDKNVYVRFRDYPTAQGFAAEIAHQEAEKEEQAQHPEEFEEMSRRKRIIVQVVSVIAFLVVVMLVVFGADYVANWLRDMFI